MGPDDKDRSRSGQDRLTRIALTLGSISTVVVLAVGFWAYESSHRALVAHMTMANRALAASVRAHAEELIRAGMPAARALEDAWRVTGAAERGRFLCLVGDDGRLRMHTSHPERVGSLVWGTKLSNPDQDGSVRQLIEQHGDWAGQNVNFGGVPQVVAYTYSAPLSGLVAVHVPKRALEADMQSSLWPWVLALCLVALTLLPATVLAMRLAFRRARKSLAESEQAQARLSADLRQAQRLETVGRMAGGIAHDFNNLLTVVLGNTGMLRAELDSATPGVEKALGSIEDACEGASRMIKQLLAFSRRQRLTPEPIDVGEVVRNFVPMLSGLAGARVQLDIDAPEAVPAVNVDRGQLEQVLANLTVNGRDAMGGIGQLSIRVRVVTEAADDLSPRVELDAGAWVELSVHDGGGGIPDTVGDQVFEPFFTTKDDAEGHGLGLSTVHGIVMQSGGKLGFSSQAGAGTTFRIYLPTAKGPASIPAPRVTLAPPAPAPSALSVLLVDDQAMVRQIVQRCLERLGHQVHVVDCPRRAIDLFEQTHVIDLLVTDIEMPGMSGYELADALRARHPSLPILFMSGYDRHMPDTGEKPLPDSSFLAKPFSVQDLNDAVRGLVHEPTTATICSAG